MDKLYSLVTWCKFEGQGKGGKENSWLLMESFQFDCLFVVEACLLIYFLLVKPCPSIFQKVVKERAVWVKKNLETEERWMF